MRKDLLTLVAYSTLTLVGLLFTIIPPCVPSILDTFNLSLTQAGAFFLVQFAGYFVGVVFTGILSDILGRKPIYCSGILSASAGLIWIGFSPNPLSLFIAIFTMGLGLGALDGAANTLILDINKDRRGSALNLLHAFFGIGALIGPFIGGGIISAGYNWRLAFVIEGLIAGIFLIFTFFVKFPTLHDEAKSDMKGFISLLSKPVIILCMLIICFYVASEMGISSWIPSFMEFHHGVTPIHASTDLSLFWAAVVLGRLFGGGFAEKIKYERLIFISAAGSSLTILLSGVLSSVYAVDTFLILTGLFYAVIYPNVVAVATKAYPQFTATVTGLLVASGGIGGVVFPFFMGSLADNCGMSWAIVSAVAPMLGIIILLEILKRQGKQ
jgi:fucose permease